jgi:GT2 family glycosyltransferase
MKIKIAIGIPTTGTIKSKTAFSLIETVRLSPTIDFLPIFRHGGYVAENKAKIVEIAQNCLCSHIFFVDHDMKFDPNVLPILLSYDKDIVGALYHYRYLPLTPMLKYFNEKGEWTPKIEESTLKRIPDELFETASVAGGMMLVKMSVFEKIEKPYFPMEQDEEGNRAMTEDCGFFLKAQAAGFKVWCDPTLDIRHIGDYEY